MKSIGSLIAKRLEPFGCIISYNSTSKKQRIPYRYYPDLLFLAANNDVIALSCALNDQTHHIVNREVMEALGKKGIIINVGRGGLIDEMEMNKCLVDGVIGGAGLDVFEIEPGVPEELFGLDKFFFFWFGQCCLVSTCCYGHARVFGQYCAACFS
ncbi:unnamed protein product [Brassica oleracea var. botrytis]